MDDAQHYASIEQAYAAIKALKDEDYLRLERAAKALLFKTQSHGAEDLVAEALERVAAHSRRWPTRVPFPKFLVNVMRSIASEWRGEAAARHEDLGQTDDAGGIELNNGSAQQSPLDRLLQKEEIEAIEQRFLDRFRDNEVVLSIVMGRFEGMKAAEIVETFGLTQTQYDSAKTALRRAKTALLRPENDE